MNTFLTLGMEPTNQTIPPDLPPSAGGGDWIWVLLFIIFVTVTIVAVHSLIKKFRSKKS